MRSRSRLRIIRIAVDRRAVAAVGLLPGDRRRGRAGRDVGGAGGPRSGRVRAASKGGSPDQYSMVSYYRPELGLPGMGLVGRQLWSQSGLQPSDIQTAILYDISRRSR